MGVTEVPNKDMSGCDAEKYEMSVAQLSSTCVNVAGDIKCLSDVARLRDQGNSMGVAAAEAYGVSVALHIKYSECVQPSKEILKVQTTCTQKSDEIANIKASKNANPKRGTVGFLGRAGPSKERGEVENTNFETKIDGYI